MSNHGLHYAFKTIITANEDGTKLAPQARGLYRGILNTAEARLSGLANLVPQFFMNVNNPQQNFFLQFK